MIRKVLIGFIVLFFCQTVFAQAPDWYLKLLQIKPLKSNESDVERIFGQLEVKNSFIDGGIGAVTYKTLNGQLYVTYAAGNCERSYDYNVVKGTVVKIHFKSDRFTKFSKFKINERDFQTRDDDAGWLYYFNKDVGIEYEVYRGKIDGVGLFPASEYDHLKCVNVKENR
jgi:hypothetical protein